MLIEIIPVCIYSWNIVNTKIEMNNWNQLAMHLQFWNIYRMNRTAIQLLDIRKNIGISVFAFDEKYNDAKASTDNALIYLPRFMLLEKEFVNAIQYSESISKIFLSWRRTYLTLDFNSKQFVFSLLIISITWLILRQLHAEWVVFHLVPTK